MFAKQILDIIFHSIPISWVKIHSSIIGIKRWERNRNANWQTSHLVNAWKFSHCQYLSLLQSRYLQIYSDSRWTNIGNYCAENGVQFPIFFYLLLDKANFWDLHKIIAGNSREIFGSMNLNIVIMLYKYS